MQDMRRRVKQQHGLASVATLHAGVVTVVQRFRSDLGLYVHLHCLATDGAYEEQGDGELRFLPTAPPTPERMTAVLAQVHEVIRAADDDLDLDPALAACVQLALAGPHLAASSQPAAPPPMTLTWYERWLDGALARADLELEHLRALVIAAERAPEDLEVWRQLASEAALRGAWPRMREAVARAQALGATTLETPAIASLQYITLRTARYAGLFAQGYPLHPLANSALQLALGELLAAQGRHAEAVEAMAPVLASGARLAGTDRYRGAMAKSRLALGRPGEALALLEVTNMHVRCPELAELCRTVTSRVPF
jgi:tetratricopeptide (TPR) repeat protein